MISLCPSQPGALEYQDSISEGNLRPLCWSLWTVGGVSWFSMLIPYVQWAMWEPIGKWEE